MDLVQLIHALVVRMIVTLNHFVLMKDFGAANLLKIIAKSQEVVKSILLMLSAMARY